MLLSHKNEKMFSMKITIIKNFYEPYNIGGAEGNKYGFK
jgi:hypothetical protein